MLTIYSSSEHTKRLEYIARHLFNEILGMDFQITADKKQYLATTAPCINYSKAELNHGLQIFPQGLLFETNIHPPKALKEGEWKGLFCFFYSGKGAIPFDLFAASFYLLTLYEEYFPEEWDQHGRFNHKEALLFRKGLLETPIIDRWAYELKKELENAGFDTSDFKLRKYRAIATYDIDHPFLYRYKGFFKNTGGLLRDTLQGYFRKIKERLAVHLRLQEDPYLASLRFIDQIQTEQNRPYYLFVLLGKRGKYGHTTVYQPKAYFKYLKTLVLSNIGLHPSYDTLRNMRQLSIEKNQLEEILQAKITLSRQHFLRMQVPETFQELQLSGVEEDFTLAFAHAPGFRSGTAVPHFFYDLQKDEATSLLIRPTIVMDSTFIFHLKSSPEETLQTMKRLADECKQSGGDYLSLWHNSNLAGTPEKNPWINVFIQSTRYAISLENH
ncbi:polysaccharide deacetylase [Bacteroidia bacterium]|nr:polysaccharide deacetylase [Bacteroidia bacterium]